jgi:hypothetical protein
MPQQALRQTYATAGEANQYHIQLTRNDSGASQHERGSCDDAQYTSEPKALGGDPGHLQSRTHTHTHSHTHIKAAGIVSTVLKK